MFSIGARPVSKEDPVSEEPYQDEMDTCIEGKGYATTGRAQRRNFPENLRRPTLTRIRMEYMSFDGTVTMLLRVVAPQTPGDDRWILRRPRP